MEALLNYIRRTGASLQSAGHVLDDLVVGADVDLPFVHVWLCIGHDSSSPLGANRQHTWGAEVSFTLARRFFALLGGSLAVQTDPGGMLSFHIRLPLPTLSDLPASGEPQHSVPVLVISSIGAAHADLPGSLLASDAVRSLQSPAQLEDLLQHTRPGALLWDAAHAAAADWDLLLAVRKHQQLQRLPFLLYAPPAEAADPSAGPALVRGRSLSATIAELCPATASKSILIVESDHTLARAYTTLIERSLPGVPIAVAGSAGEASSALQHALPSLLILDPELPDCDGLDLVEQLRADEETRHSPVLVLSCRPLDAELLARFAYLSPVVFAGKYILTLEELAALISRALAGAETLPSRTSDMVKQAVFYIEQHFDQPLNRSDVADAIAVSENYLSQIFRQEMGVSLWDYLNRLRINHARHLLQSSALSITGVAAAVGIFDPAYFSRIFHKQVGLSPSAYRVNAHRIPPRN
jgi:AraC-like DNA-binding protein